MQGSAAEVVMERAAILGRYSEESDRLTRRFATAPMREVNAVVADWMRAAGMTVRQDNIGNLRGRYEGQRPDARTLILGSHLDTVRDAGKYDGPLGVLAAIAVVQRLHDGARRLPCAIEVLAFADEEGLRYTSFLGSRVVAGSFNPAHLERVDADGISLRAAIAAFGGDPAALADDRRDPSDLVGYCELHIEQGPVLEARDVPVGVVTAIQGRSGCAVTFRGAAGHAGTVPMDARHDPLVAAAEFVVAVDRYARATPGLVATVGQFSVEPGASNVIPGRATLSLDVRHPDDARREQACADLREQASAIAATRGVELGWEFGQASPAVPCSSELAGTLARAIAELGYPVQHLPSGAGHDAAVMSALTPIAMLFVRCRDGISHNPAESVEVADVAVALDVLGRFCELVAEA